MILACPDVVCGLGQVEQRVVHLEDKWRWRGENVAERNGGGGPSFYNERTLKRKNKIKVNRMKRMNTCKIQINDDYISDCSTVLSKMK